MLQEQLAQLQMQYKEQIAFIQKMVSVYKAKVIENQQLTLARSRIASKTSTPSQSTTMLSYSAATTVIHGQIGHVPRSCKPLNYVQPEPTLSATGCGQLDQYSCGDIVDSIIWEDISVDAELFKTTNAMIQDQQVRA